jgi:hypothetical protein
MDCKRFDWPELAGEPDEAWFGYLRARGWTVNPVPELHRVGRRRYRSYLGWRVPHPA